MSDEQMEEGIVYRKCQVCGKPVVTLHPTQWAYKKRHGKNDYTFWCSWKCLREAERKANMKKLTLEKKRKAVEIALAGGNPLDYLRENGIVNAAGSWAKIKNTLKYEDPQAYAKIPQRIAPTKAPETPAAEEPAAPAADGTAPAEAKEPGKKPAWTPVNYGGYDVSAIRHPVLGEFYANRKHGVIDWRTPEGEEISLTPKEWKALYGAIPDVMGILGGED